MEREKYITRVTLIGSGVNFGLVLFKFVAGIFGRSSAMLADAVHSLSDFASDIIVLWCVRLAEKPEDEDHAYGHAKFETLASVAIGLILLGTGLGLLWNGVVSIVAFFQGEPLPTPTWLALLAAIISILAKEALYHYTLHAAKKINSDALKANAWHHRSDSLSSIATVLGIGGAMLAGQNWVFLDPLAAAIISLFIIGMAFSLMKPGIDELMEKSLPAQEITLIKEIIASTPGVQAWHHLRTRRLGANRAIEVHIKLDGNMPLGQAHDIATSIEKHLREALGQHTHIGIHMEPVKPMQK